MGRARTDLTTSKTTNDLEFWFLEEISKKIVT